MMIAGLAGFAQIAFGRGDVLIKTPAVKVCQIAGDWDRERGEPTLNRTGERYGLPKTDLGAPFTHKGRTYVVFGDSFTPPGDDDPIAVSDDTNLEDGLSLTFLQDEDGSYRPVRIPGVRLSSFEVPMEGVSVNGRLYVYATTDHSDAVSMGRSVLAVSTDDGYNFSYVYDFSTNHFINVSVVKTDFSQRPQFEMAGGEGLVIFGSGPYRYSDVRLAIQPAQRIEDKSSLRYFSGLSDSGQPRWSAVEGEAQPLFSQPCVGELSVSYNRFIRKWILLYNDHQYRRGINMRTADQPWGPWSQPEIIFHPWWDGGYCHFMHSSSRFLDCDQVNDPEQSANVWGAEYGPYQFEDHATGDGDSTTIYFTLSTWNPYTVVLMKATLQRVSGQGLRGGRPGLPNWILREPIRLPCGRGFDQSRDVATLAACWLSDQP